MTAIPCYCQGSICGHSTLTVGTDRIVHVDSAIEWGVGDVRSPWSGSFDFGSFACIGAWAADRAQQHDGRILAAQVDQAPAPVTVAPTGETVLSGDIAAAITTAEQSVSAPIQATPAVTP